MDTMNAVEFLDKIDRLSQIGSVGEKIRYTDYRTAGDNVGAVKFVKQWAAEHPIKTRQSEFLKHYPGARISVHGCLNACPMDVFSDADINCNVQPCFECKKAFWLAEVEDV